VTGRYDYVTVGHVTLDLIEDRPGGTVAQPGGGAFYSALQAARLGLRTLIVTQGVPAQIEEMLSPYATELDLYVIRAPHTTTLVTNGSGSARSQRVTAWAGPILEPLEPRTSILHLAAAARETPNLWRGEAEFVGLTPQGLVRRWQPSQTISLVALDPTRLPPRFHAAVIGERERECCDALFQAARRNGAPVAVTAGPEPTTIYAGGCETAPQAVVPPTATVREDLGAGDVFAAAFFLALLEGMPPTDSAAFGNAAAAIRVAGSSAEAIGRRGEIEAALG
jgi:sugar/nucleoside kinase (ribokinase family)